MENHEETKAIADTSSVYLEQDRSWIRSEEEKVEACASSVRFLSLTCGRLH